MIRKSFFSAVVAILMCLPGLVSSRCRAPEERLIEAMKVALG
jgi:hypothetical protein